MLDNLSLKQKKIIIIIGALVLVGIMYFIFNKNEKQNIITDENILIGNSEQNAIIDEKTEDIEDMIVIHITGAVKKPGIVRLQDGSRIEDAIEKAGGLTEDADISNVNLAYILEDGTKITIPRNSEIEDIEDSNLITKESGKNIIQDINTNDKSYTTVNINKATQGELETIPGIGSSIAQKIISYRDENGKFSTIEDIKNVSGIGDNKYEAIKDYISVK